MQQKVDKICTFVLLLMMFEWVMPDIIFSQLFSSVHIMPLFPICKLKFCMFFITWKVHVKTHTKWKPLWHCLSALSGLGDSFSVQAYCFCKLFSGRDRSLKDSSCVLRRLTSLCSWKQGTFCNIYCRYCLVLRAHGGTEANSASANRPTFWHCWVFIRLKMDKVMRQTHKWLHLHRFSAGIGWSIEWDFRSAG